MLTDVPPRPWYSLFEKHRKWDQWRKRALEASKLIWAIPDLLDELVKEEYGQTVSSPPPAFGDNVLAIAEEICKLSGVSLMNKWEVKRARKLAKKMNLPAPDRIIVHDQPPKDQNDHLDRPPEGLEAVAACSCFLVLVVIGLVVLVCLLACLLGPWIYYVYRVEMKKKYILEEDRKFTFKIT